MSLWLDHPLLSEPPQESPTPTTSFTPSSFFSSTPAPAPIRSKKSLPFPLPDPYADDAPFQVYDPHGFFKSRRTSSVHSRAGTVGSEDSAGAPHSREDSGGKPGGKSRLGRALAMSSSVLEEMAERVRDESVDERVPSLSPSGAGDDELSVASPSAEVSLLTSPVLPSSLPASQTDPQLHGVALSAALTSPTSPIDIEPTPSHPLPITPSDPTARGRNPFHQLRIGSSGSHAPYLALSTDTQEAARFARSPSHLSDDTSESISRSRSNSSGMPWSPAANFLSTFSPESSAGGGFQAPVAGDQEGHVVAGHVLGRELGEGGFGVVREAKRIEDDERVAVKIVRHQHVEPVSHVGAALKRSTSGFRIPSGKDRTATLSSPTAPTERIRSSSSPAPPHLLRQSLSKQTHDLSASLSSLPHPPTPGFGCDPDTAPPSLLQSLLEREILLWQQLAPHPHIMPLLAVHHTSEFSYIFMPLCEGGNLLSFLNSHTAAPRRAKGRTSIPIGATADGEPRKRGLPLPTCLPIFAQVVSGLHYLHTEAAVTHKDVKLENILCDAPGGTWKIADFGLAETATATARLHEHEHEDPYKRHGHSISERGPVTPGTPLASLSRAASLSRPDEERKHVAEHLYPAGSLPYSPPEQMKSPVPILDPSVDVWALGCVLYALVEGRLPFEDDFEPRLRMKILKGAWEVPSALAPSEGEGKSRSRSKGREDGEKALVLEVLRGCLEPDPTRRWTIDRVRSCAWLAGDQVRGRGMRNSTPSDGGSSRSPSTSARGSRSGSRRKERSTSRGPLLHYGVDPRTRESERKVVEREDRKMRWEREGRGAILTGASAEGSGSGSRSREGEGERLGRVAEPY